MGTDAAPALSPNRRNGETWSAGRRSTSGRDTVAWPPLTASLLVAQNGRLACEQYCNGFGVTVEGLMDDLDVR
jgi:hypothetical protein